MPTLGCVEIVRYKAIVEEIFQARIPKIRISTTTGATARRFQQTKCERVGETFGYRGVYKVTLYSLGGNLSWTGSCASWTTQDYGLNTHGSSSFISSTQSVNLMTY